MRDLDTEQLVAAVLTDDRGAWTELVRRYSGLVWSVARSFRLPEQDAEDVFQTTWLLFAQNVRTLRTPHAVGAWLKTTARREGVRAAVRYRRDRWLSADEELAERADPGPSPDDEAMRAALQAQVRQGLSQLSQNCQQLLSLLSRDPPASYREISAKTGMRAGSIGPIRARCLERLRRACRL